MFGRKKIDSKMLGKRLAAYSGTSADQANWVRWLSFKTRTWHDLELVLGSMCLNAFKVRALTAMLCWDHALDPFKGRVATAFSGSNLYAGQQIQADIEPHMADVAAVVVNFCLEAIDAGRHAPDGARDLYNQCIPSLLENIHDTRLGDELFKRYRGHAYIAPEPDRADRTRFTIFDYAFFANIRADDW